MGGKRKMEEDKLSQLYSVLPWPDNPESKAGQEYYETTLGFMKRLIQHPWLEEILSRRKKIRILEVCGGAGYGGVALSRTILNRASSVSLLITDLRKKALARAKKWGTQVIGKRVETLVIDVKKIHTLRRKFDLALMYGLSTPHFNPRELVRLLSSVSDRLEEDGIFVVDEMDRRYTIFLNVGYKWALAEGAEEDRLAVSFHSGYDPSKGTFKRVFIDLARRGTPVTLETFMWGLAEVAAMMWIFFKAVDLVQLRATRHFILGYRPRKILKPQDLKENK
ncbi:hypothetical protein DRP53_05550 [candidate division WOR-3 bacterium]|uniref:Methyltransferase domain-containing protein n=1 Tax=candidate division WOR-3 bacterium TaxID=2052148 RepID=A0A660SHL2_UNCW3|nr:MAG: hypothetical protein DRP53_05550 [candidate division WOR-3 bacterium]